MPIRREVQHLYPRHWPVLSKQVKAAGTCDGCGRPHMRMVRCLPDGRWWDAGQGVWRDGRGRLTNRWPSLLEATYIRETRVVLAACHVDGNRRNNRRRNLRAWCQRCHLLADLPMHVQQRWFTRRLRYAFGDLFVDELPPHVRQRWLAELRRHGLEEPRGEKRESRPAPRRRAPAAKPLVLPGGRFKLTEEARLPLLA